MTKDHVFSINRETIYYDMESLSFQKLSDK